MAQCRDDKNKLILVREPIWSKQAGESEANHNAFNEYLNADGQLTMTDVVRKHNISANVYTDDRWRERAEHFWSHIDQQVQDAMQRRMMKLRELSLASAITLAQEHESSEEVVRTKINAKKNEALYVDRTIIKRKHAPNSYIVSKVLESELQRSNIASRGTEEISAILREMVSATYGDLYASDNEGNA